MPESVGKTLKKYRETKHLSIQEVSERTRIPKKIISAIEDDKLHEISSPFYAKGFVKSYAIFLGALEEKAVKEYLTDIQKRDAPALTPKLEGKQADWFKKYKSHIGAVVVVVFGIWILYSGFVNLGKFVRHVASRPKIQVVKQQEVGEVQDTAPEQEEIKGVKLEIIAHYNTWLQVVSDGELLFRGILKKKTWDVWQAEEEIALEVGNAGGVALKVNGKDLGPPGKKGEKKTLLITKDGIK